MVNTPILKPIIVGPYKKPLRPTRFDSKASLGPCKTIGFDFKTSPFPHRFVVTHALGWKPRLGQQWSIFAY